MSTLAYIASENVVVIDTSTNTVLDTIATGAYPTGIAITPDGTFVYVTNNVTNDVAVIDTSRNMVIATVRVGDYPSDIAITPNGRFAYVVNTFSDTVSVISTSTNTVVATIPVGKLPNGIAISPNGSFAYVTNTMSNTVSVIYTGTNTVEDTIPIPVGAYPVSIATSPDNLVYVGVQASNFVNGFVIVIDIYTNNVVDNIPLDSYPTGLAVTPNGRFVYVSLGALNTVDVIFTGNDVVVAKVEVGTLPTGIAITPDGRFAYVTNTGSSNVSIIDTSSNAVVAAIPVSLPVDIAIGNIPQQQTPQTVCIETTRIFDSCMFEDEAQKTFEFPNLNKDADIQCKILKTKYNILDISRIDEQKNLVDVKLEINVLLGFTNKLISNNTVTRVISFERNITLTSPEDADISCDINNVTCACKHTIGGGSSSCNYKLDCTVKVAAVVQSKKLVQIQVPFLGECTPRQCCPGAGMPMSPGTSYPLPSQPSQISRIRFTGKTNPGMTSRVIAFLNGLPMAFATVIGERKAFELNLTGGPFPVGNVRLINAGNSTIYICNLTTE